MLINKENKLDKETVGCIITYKSKYLLCYRNKDSLWGSISGNIKKSESPQDAIKREIREELNLNIVPSFFTTTYHQYGSEKIAYHIYQYNFDKNPLEDIEVDNVEISKVDLFDLNDALKQNLFEDEDYCLKLHAQKQNLV